LKTAFGPLTVDNAASVKVKSGALPSGMKLEKDANGKWWVAGVPGKTADNARLVLQAMDGKTGGTTLAFNYTVLPLPREAFGSFNGAAMVSDGTDTVYGLASMTVSAAGKISGKLAMPNSRTYTLVATGYDALENGIFSVTNDLFTAKLKNKTPIPVKLAINTIAPGAGNGSLSSADGISAELSRDGWSDKEGLKAEREAALRLALNYNSGAISKASGGYYTLIMTNGVDNGMAGTGYLTITVDKKGKVKTAGKLADGTALSMSSALLLDASGIPYLDLATAPKAYAGGFFTARLEFTREALAPGRVLLNSTPNAPALWKSRNPRAIGTQNAGFQIELDVLGGWYSKTDKLADMYDDSVGLIANVQGWMVNAAFNAKGTGLSALPACGSANNGACLKLSVKPKTGLFTGSFNESVNNKTVTRKLQGVLTPALTFEGAFGGLDGIAGAGYYLVPQTTPYKFNLSGDFVLEPDCDCGP
jgi:hypothetical protein